MVCCLSLRWFNVKAFLLCSTGLLCFSVAAISQPGPADLQAQDKAHIEGTLVSQVSGLPLQKGTVVLRLLPVASAAPVASASTYTAISNLDGRFAFDKIEPGSYTLAAGHPGYLPGNYRKNGSRIVRLIAGGELKDLRVALVPLGVIAGQVVDEEGIPITEVQVQILRSKGLGGAHRLVSEVAVPVDDQGKFRAANLIPGQYYLAAEQRLVESATGIRTDAPDGKCYVTTFYPNALDASQAAPVTLNAGEVFSGVMIRLRRTRVVRIQGRAIDSETGAPLSYVSLRLMPKDTDPALARPKTTPIRDGSFTFDKILPGSYVIEPTPGVTLVGPG